MKEKICAILGQGALEGEKEAFLLPRLDRALQNQLAAGATVFACGLERGVSLLAAERILALKEAAAGLELWLVLPGHDQWLGWGKEEVCRYQKILSRGDRIICAGNRVTPASQALYRRYLRFLGDSYLYYGRWSGRKGKGNFFLHAVRRQGKEASWDW